MRAVALIYLIAVLFLLPACQGGGGPKPGVHVNPTHANLDYVPSGWTPEKIELECAAKSECPAQVGLLIFVFPEANGKIPFSRCTAFLSAVDQITSNAHCDQTGAAKGYFVSVGSQKQVRTITRTIFKRYTSGGNGGVDSERPDVAVYELNEAVLSFPPLSYAISNDETYDRLIGYVVNRGEDASHYRVEELHCQVRRHEALFPYNLKENPDVITAFGCRSKRANSGGPLFAPNSNEVQGVLQWTSERERKRRHIREKLGRDLFAHESHDTVLATNLRCLGSSPANCLRADLTESQSRFTAMQRRAVEAVGRRPAPASATDRVRYRAVAFQTLDHNVLRFEIFHEPTCYLGDQRPKRILVPLEFLSLDFNDWGELNSRVVETRMAEFKLKPNPSSRVEIEATWPEPFAEVVNSQQHPRHTWGRTFSIELPRCPR